MIESYESGKKTKFMLGDNVYISGFDSIGRIIKINKKSKKVILDINNKRVSSRVSDLIISSDEPEKKSTILTKISASSGLFSSLWYPTVNLIMDPTPVLSDVSW